MSNFKFYRKKVNFKIEKFTRENVEKFVGLKRRKELKFVVKALPFFDELHFKFLPNVKWDLPNVDQTQRGLGVSIGSNVKDEFRNYQAKFRLFLVKGNGDKNYCSTADESYIFYFINDRARSYRPLVSLEDLFKEENEFLINNELKIYVEIILKTSFSPSSAIPQSIALKNYERLVNNEILSDFHFICSDGEKIFAHKCILQSFSNQISSNAEQSHFFKTMLESNMKESRDNCMLISDFNSKTILELMRFVYCERVRVDDSKHFIPLIFAADKYDIAKLKSYCVTMMNDCLSVENVVEILGVTDTLDEMQDLKENCIDFIKFNYSEIKKSGNLQKMKFEMISEVMDSINQESAYLNFHQDLSKSFEIPIARRYEENYTMNYDIGPQILQFQRNQLERAERMDGRLYENLYYE